MKLYGRYTSPYVRHCRIALIEAGLDCDFIETDMLAAAHGSPTQRVPFLKDGELELTDSGSILMHVRRKAGGEAFNDVRDYELFCLVNTLLEATITLFFLERDDKIGPAQSSYLARHRARIQSGLSDLNARTWSKARKHTVPAYSEGELRLLCFLGWALFRQRIDLTPFPQLQSFLDLAADYGPFEQTKPIA